MIIKLFFTSHVAEEKEKKDISHPRSHEPCGDPAENTSPADPPFLKGLPLSGVAHSEDGECGSCQSKGVRSETGSLASFLLSRSTILGERNKSWVRF